MSTDYWKKACHCGCYSGMEEPTAFNGVIHIPRGHPKLKRCIPTEEYRIWVCREALRAIVACQSLEEAVKIAQAALTGKEPT